MAKIPPGDSPKKRITPLSWFFLALAVATFVVACIAAADFSGKPPPHWREPFVFSGLMVVLLRVFFLERRRRAER